MNTREENEKLRALLREIRPTIPRDVLELWSKDRDSALSQQADHSEGVLALAEPAPAQDELFVYRAVNRFGIDCHFGVESLARVWAGTKGTVERVTLTPVPEFSVVATLPEQTELVEALRLALPIVEHEAKKMQSAEQQFPNGFDSTEAVKALAAIKAALAKHAKEPRE